MSAESGVKTAVSPVDAQKIGSVKATANPGDLLDSLDIDWSTSTQSAANLLYAASQLKHSDIPVAFPTETVYGLGADATRSAAVRGIYKAKQRPVDNPLIVHFSSLQQLRDLLRSEGGTQRNGISSTTSDADSIPRIYHPLISRFWPGPLTIILPNPPNSPLAPEVTAGLSTFGARMPRHVLALALIQKAGVPVAAPSANASTKPSPTAAEHVAHDLDGRIETIIDGGPCDVGVESTVVDGLSDPPLILRPGGISIEQLRSCAGWENVQIGYKNSAEGGSQPKAPGMKYRHYSPKATVVLYEAGKAPPTLEALETYVASSRRIGVITTKSWVVDESTGSMRADRGHSTENPNGVHTEEDTPGFRGMLKALHSTPTPRAAMKSHSLQLGGSPLQLLEISLGPSTAKIARGIFAALRELDREDVDAIFVEGIDENEVMNRLRKAAEIKISP
ncbi:uncharacterized protein LTR77_006272 [Saxophila tyrrhenica]|uniref:Threonylcarbamoyl-AMP synthase n=1 Tax=Saxophila tyrrhenica TaxID=1690608 RepID=A0AAV9P894_9PEZI|nr:hypothetical protein LTR77_006272 [Saxophila tyrrhenica]